MSRNIGGKNTFCYTNTHTTKGHNGYFGDKISHFCRAIIVCSLKL